MTRATPLMDRLIRRSLEHAVPLCVQFDLTWRCNERCVHCYLDHEGDGEMDTAEVRRVLQELSRAGTLFLTFSGGEVFLRGDFFELAAEARRLHFDIGVKTNGILIDAAGALRLKALGVRKAQVSIYSADAALHEAITRAPGSFARSIRAIRLLRESGLEVTMACALMRGNAGGYRGLRALAEELGVHLLLDPTITPRLNGDLGPLALRTPAPDLVPLLADPKMNGAGKTSELPGSRPDPHRLEACATADPYRSVPCSAGRNSVYISPFGDVYPCVQMPVSAGNLRKQSFTEIWHESRQMKEVRSVNASSVRVCSACAIRRYCQRCPGLALMEDGDMAGPSLRACELAEQRAHLAGLDNPVSPYRIRKTTAGAGQQNDGNFGLEISDCGFQAPASLEIRNPKSEIRNSCD